MPTINSVRVDTTGWELLEQSDSQIVWRNEIPDGLFINFFNLKPDIPADLNNEAELRRTMRQGLKTAGGGLVSLRVIPIQQVPSLEQIIKVPIPNQQHGLIYIGSYILPFAEFSYVVKVQCQEWGTTGIRDAVVGNEFLGSGKVQIDENTNQLVGWMLDPDLDANQSEHEKYDVQFPDHPLSRTRRYLERIRNTLMIDADVLKAEKFKFNKKGGFLSTLFGRG